MNLYLAESGGVWGAYFKDRPESDLFAGTNILQSFYYCNNFTERTILSRCKNFMLDSGAFTFFSAGGFIDWDSYIERYAQFIKRNGIKLYYELDIDPLIGYEKVLYYRSKIEDMTGGGCYTRLAQVARTRRIYKNVRGV